MSSTARSVSLRQFNHMAEYRVMLLSLKAGGIGLNLQRANHMVILDRWWNPGNLCALHFASFNPPLISTFPFLIISRLQQRQWVGLQCDMKKSF